MWIFRSSVFCVFFSSLLPLHSFTAAAAAVAIAAATATNVCIVYDSLSAKWTGFLWEWTHFLRVFMLFVYRFVKWKAKFAYELKLNRSSRIDRYWNETSTNLYCCCCWWWWCCSSFCWYLFLRCVCQKAISSFISMPYFQSNFNHLQKLLSLSLTHHRLLAHPFRLKSGFYCL